MQIIRKNQVLVSELFSLFSDVNVNISLTLNSNE